MPATRAVFIDTSVLDNLLQIPGKDQDWEQAQRDFVDLQRNTAVQFVLPVTAVIEVGNHIAQLKNGDDRRRIAAKFGGILENVCGSEAPWVLHDFDWGETFLRSFLDGAITGATWTDLAQAGIGGGDLSILVEADLFQQRLKIASEIWTYDQGLRSYSPLITPERT